MDRKVIIEKLQEIFRDVLGDENLIIQESTNAGDIDEWDSLAHITILEAVQDEFGVKFTLDEMVELNDVAKIIDAIVQGG